MKYIILKISASSASSAVSYTFPIGKVSISIKLAPFFQASGGAYMKAPAVFYYMKMRIHRDGVSYQVFLTRFLGKILALNSFPPIPISPIVNATVI